MFVSKPRPRAPVSFYSLVGLLVVTDEEALLAFKAGGGWAGLETTSTDVWDSLAG